MEIVEFRTVEQDLGGRTLPVIVPHLSGVPLPDLLRRIELPSARRDGQPELAGGYAGLATESVRWPARHYLDQPVLTASGGGTVLLGCVCGDWGCWPFSARVTVADDTVTWSDYRNGHRDWDYRDLWDLTFDRSRYERAVRATAG